MTYDAALKNIHPNNWNKCTVEEKKDALQAIVNHVSEEQRRASMKIGFQRNSLTSWEHMISFKVKAL